MATRKSPDASGSLAVASSGSGNAHPQRLRSPPAQRRDKPPLSCSLCKRRKVRCDRQNPCGTCSKRGLARSCVYSDSWDSPDSVLPQTTGTVHERVHQLESLVISLMHQNTTAAASVITPRNSIYDTQGVSDHNQEGFGASDLLPPMRLLPNATSPTPESSGEGNLNQLSAPGECGSLNLDSLGTANYVGSTHWATILDSITDLKSHFKQQEDTRRIAYDIDGQNSGAPIWPQLLYGGSEVTAADVLSSIPPRREADRLVARYFSLEIAAGVLHSGQFLRNYDDFWEEPASVPIMWVGLLFTILCLGALHPSQTTTPTLDPQLSFRINIFREKIVQCLKLGKYTKGGPFILLTLIQYYMIENFLSQDAEFEIWILHCLLMPMSFRTGLHRDPKHFKEISPFEGEMRRRVWATIFQVDACLSSMMGLPRTIKPEQCDTEEPRNLLDSDFDEQTTELVQSRPESELTPILYLIAKNRIISVGGIISDLSHDVRPYPYDARAGIEKLLEDTRTGLPSSLQWQPLAQSITENSQTIMQRIYLEISFHKMRITLYKKHLAASITQIRYGHAADVCLDSAMKILEHQHMLYEEMQLDGRLSSVNWSYISILDHDFLLAASILCFYIEKLKVNRGEIPGREIPQGAFSILRRSHDIWLQSRTTSKRAEKAVQSLGLILGIQYHREEEEAVINFFNHSAHPVAQFVDPLSWPTRHDFPMDYELLSPELETMIDGFCH